MFSNKLIIVSSVGVNIRVAASSSTLLPKPPKKLSNVEKIILGSIMIRLMPLKGSILKVLIAKGAENELKASLKVLISTFSIPIFGVVRKTSINPIRTCRANRSFTKSTAAWLKPKALSSIVRS